MRNSCRVVAHPVTTDWRCPHDGGGARDIAHAKIIKERLDRGEGMPEYLKQHPVLLRGPAKTPEGLPSASFGPTTAGRMDAYVDCSRPRRSMVMIAKGNRSPQVTRPASGMAGSTRSIGGPAALLARENIRKVEILEYRSSAWSGVRIEVQDFPAFILVDDKRERFLPQLS